MKLIIFALTISIFNSSWNMESPNDEEVENTQDPLDFVGKPSKEQIKLCRTALEEIGIKGEEERLSAFRDIIFDLKNEKDAIYGAKIILVASYSLRSEEFRLNYLKVLEYLLEMASIDKPNIELLLLIIKTLPKFDKKFEEESFQDIFIKLLFSIESNKGIDEDSRYLLRIYTIIKIEPQYKANLSAAFDRNKHYFSLLFIQIMSGRF